MDLVKIGSYIAEKRKKLGMTQKQLAEKLGNMIVMEKHYQYSNLHQNYCF